MLPLVCSSCYTALTKPVSQLLFVWYFIVETRGYTLEEIYLIFDTPGLTWNQRRNMRAPRVLGDFPADEKAGDVTPPEKAVPVVSEKSVGEDGSVERQ